MYRPLCLSLVVSKLHFTDDERMLVSIGHTTQISQYHQPNNCIYRGRYTKCSQSRLFTNRCFPQQQLLPAIFLTGALKHLLVSSTMLSVELQRLWRVIEPRRIHLEERRRILLIFQSYKSLWNTGRFEVFAERNFQVLSPIHATLSRKNTNNKFCTRKLLIM